ncbi:hypothetical protein CHUAL_005741 [Chamberlinius hualienensis]
MGDEDVEENLYGCYLLYCLNEKYKGHTYIGYTVNPSRRIKQHNGGVKANGAKRTSNKGPWEMALLVYGFPNANSALRFEWAWQHPRSSRRLKHVRSKKSRETAFQYRFYLMSEMIRVGPWNRLPLIIRWLKQSYFIEFDVSLRPPSHMPIVFGPVITKKVQGEQSHQAASSLQISCGLCKKSLVDLENQISCINPRCRHVSHVVCLAEHFTKGEHVIPVEGECPACKTTVLWGDLVRKKMGCYKDLTDDVSLSL